ncbi:hypothetical protein FA95DRAFT_1556236 [Auriscalpium vulgare]|uniref:Uncharacterized protein n=1 Tax=Auriscalpium vulgare TaxID=40419 RepID=A0ACB8S222_9AGAM|nr:hypothetical protein FA95DRAFT_1556236 [Auriscalpium vulgare]
MAVPREAAETDPLLPAGSGGRGDKKAFYRPRPLWIVPIALLSSLARGMTLAPRVEVYTQLSCNALHQHYNHTSGDSTLSLSHFLRPPSSLSSSAFQLSAQALTPPTPLPIQFPKLDEGGDDDDDGSDDPRRLPSPTCVSDPAVQAGAARLQMLMMTLMGGLSALTTGWWGHFSEKHGRTKVLALSTLGLLLTDLTFILVSTPSSPFSHHGHKFLLVSPVIEGLLGGWSALQAATSAYVSDCTSDGSRAHIFSRFGGVFYLGLAAGPAIGAFFIRHPLVSVPAPVHAGVQAQSVTTVFYAAILCSALNFVLAVFVCPESLDKVKRRAAEKAAAAEPAENVNESAQPTPVAKKRGLVSRLFGPLAIFAPKRRLVFDENGNGRLRKDWSLTWFACSVFVYLLSLGLFQIKYLYAEHMFGWNAEQLSYYISTVGGTRALNLLFIMPFIIATLKPAAPAPSNPSTPNSGSLAHSIKFDLIVARCSLFLDIISHTLVASPLPVGTAGFTGLTMLSSLSSAALPALHSLAICLLQRTGQGDAGLGPLFGALSVLQALGQMILGPLLFGLVYSSTVAQFPKAIFAVAAALVVVSFSVLLLISPHPPKPRAAPAQSARVLAKGKGKAPHRPAEVLEPERGRSRVVKHVGDGQRVQQPEASGSASGADLV